MSGSVNRVTLLGHLGKDPEIRTTQGGQKVASFSIATGESWRDKTTGEHKERTEWHNVVIFNEGLVGVAQRFLKKGSKVYVEGQQRTRKYQAQDGSDRYTTETVLAQFRGGLTLLDKSERPAPDTGDYGTTRTRQAPEPASGRSNFDDDEIPF